jgi:hypothetical protein
MFRTIALAVVLWAPAGVALAQDVVVGKEIPMMIVRYCPTLEDAKEEARLAQALAKEPFKDGSLDLLRHSKCALIYTRVKPLRQEAAIPRYEGWGIVYKPGGEDEIEDPTDSRRKIPVVPGLIQITWWFCNMHSKGGQKFSGWTELANKPYVLEYLKARQP